MSDDKNRTEFAVPIRELVGKTIRSATQRSGDYHNLDNGYEQDGEVVLEFTDRSTLTVRSSWCNDGTARTEFEYLPGGLHQPRGAAMNTIKRWECPECGRIDDPHGHFPPGFPNRHCPGVPVKRVYVAREWAEFLEAALRDIATRSKVERNPDGVDQAAWTMALIAEDALAAIENAA